MNSKIKLQGIKLHGHLYLYANTIVRCIFSKMLRIYIICRNVMSPAHYIAMQSYEYIIYLRTVQELKKKKEKTVIRCTSAAVVIHAIGSYRSLLYLYEVYTVHSRSGPYIPPAVYHVRGGFRGAANCARSVYNIIYIGRNRVCRDSVAVVA